MPIKFYLWSVFAVAVVACATSPTGRRQLKLIPEDTMNSMGASAFDQMKAEEPVSKDPVATAYVECLAKSLTGELEGKWKTQPWEVVVFDSDTVNAFALPGGKIGVYRGIIKVAETPGQLAAVMGHEIAHVIIGHGNERVSQNIVVQGTMVSASIFTSGDAVLQQNVMAALGLGAQLGVLLPFSRKHESEADVVGVDLAAKAGFDPGGAVELWQNMSKLGGEQPPQFMSTHPSHLTRIRDLTKHESESRVYFEQARAAGKKPGCQKP